ncbi:MAG: DUF6691 family protein [Bacteroidia bacterium]
MKYIKFILTGVLFGIVLTKGEIISWYRIQEMFRFQGFHMYGVIGSAVVLGALVLFLAKKFGWKTIEGEEINPTEKTKAWKNYLFGGIIFGLGWALTGACPGPVYMLIGTGATVYAVVLISATVGTFVYGLFRDKLPH